MKHQTVKRGSLIILISPALFNQKKSYIENTIDNCSFYNKSVLVTTRTSLSFSLSVVSPKKHKNMIAVCVFMSLENAAFPTAFSAKKIFLKTKTQQRIQKEFEFLSRMRQEDMMSNGGGFVVHGSGGHYAGGNRQNGGGRGRGGAHIPAEFHGLRRGEGSGSPGGYSRGRGGGQAAYFSALNGGGGSPHHQGGGGFYDPNQHADTYEVQDNQLKAPVGIRYNDVHPTAGSERLFSAPPQSLASSPGPGQRSVPRICESFQHGQCLHGEECQEVHVDVEVLQNIRNQMLAWLNEKESEFNGTLHLASDTKFRVFAADLKEVVDVPVGALAFTRGLYVDPSARAKRSRGGQQSAFALMAAQVPTACGLFSVDPSQCKWGRWCNQAHIDPAWMRMKRNEFEGWSRSLEQQFEERPMDYVFHVHDPQIKNTVAVPKIAIAGFSRGLFQGNAKKAPSVCMLYQRGRCTAGSCCNQIHIYPEFLNLQRQAVSEGESPGLSYHINQCLEHLRQSYAASTAAGSQPFLNPDARPFIPVTAAVQPPPPPADPFAHMQHQQGSYRSAEATPVHTHSSPTGVKSLEMSATDALMQRSMTSHPSSPPMGSKSHVMVSPYLRSGASPMADLRSEEDEMFERRRQMAVNTPTTPVKQNNPYSATGTVQKPIGVPPSPLNAAALPPAAVGNAAHQHNLPSTDRVAGTPPMQFGWLPQVRGMPTLPPPPSPFRSSTLRTPTSPQYPAPFTPDLSHMQFSPSPLMRAEQSTNIPKHLSLEGFDDLQHSGMQPYSSFQLGSYASPHGHLPASNRASLSMPPPALPMPNSSGQSSNSSSTPVDSSR
jgi:hypothetical protein